MVIRKTLVAVFMTAGTLAVTPRLLTAEHGSHPADGVTISSEDGEYPPDLPENPVLEDYLAYAAIHNPGLKAAFHRWKAALERVPQVTSLPDPRFTYGYYIREVETRVGPQRHKLGLAQTFPWFGKRPLRGDIAAETANAEQARYERAKWRLFGEVKQAYCEYYYAVRATAIVKRNIELLGYLEELIRAEYRVGTAGYADVIRTEVESGKLENQIRSLEALTGPLVSRLNATLNRAADAPVPFPGPLGGMPATISDDQLLDAVRKSNPALTVLDHEIRRQERRVDLSRKDSYPDVTLGVDYIATSEARMPGVDGSGDDAVMVTLSLNLPIWRPRYRAAEREARLQHRSAQDRRTDLENRLIAETVMALYKYRDARRRIDLYESALIPKAEQALQVAQEEYRVGKANVTDLIETERGLLEFQLARERALADQTQRLADLEELSANTIPYELIPAADDTQILHPGNEGQEQ